MSIRNNGSSCFVIFLLILWTHESLSYIIDGKKCIAFEYVTEAPKVEDVQVATLNSSTPERISFEYGQHIKLLCDINLPGSGLITWRARNKKITEGLSADHKAFNIKSLNIDFHGEYITCEATLISNPKKKKMYGTNIVISNLASPLISNLTPNAVTVMEKDNITLTCTIVRGVPAPRMTWQFKSVGENTFKDISVIGENITIENVSFKNAGKYRCTAKNVIGNATKTTELFVQKAPVVVIEKTPENPFAYGDTAEFTCKIEGYPLPNNTWIYDNKLNEPTIQGTIVNWHEKHSKIKVQKLKRSDQFVCTAENIIGTAMSSVHITVLSPFVVHQHPEATTNVHYGTSKDIVCNITSAFPMKIRWLYQTASIEKTQITYLHKNLFKISPDETRLTIYAIELDEVGNYTCEAFLIEDETEKIDFTSKVQIDDLAPPLLGVTNKVIVMEKNSLTLYCKILSGVPSATISWIRKVHGAPEFATLAGSDEQFDIENINITEAGQYRCVAENPLGETYFSTDLYVNKAPETQIEEGSAISVPYGSNQTFTCTVVAYPLPTITWKNSSDEQIGSLEDIKHEHLVSSKYTVDFLREDNIYTCEAKNPLGEHKSNIHVTVLSPFIVHEHPADKTNVHYTASPSLICNITTSFPMRIRWFYNGSEIHTSTDYTISSDETKLDIRSTNLDLIGNYTCEAYLVNQVEVNEVFTTDVQIDDLQPPIITSYTGEGLTVTVQNFEELSLTCMASGNPKPVISWKAQTGGYSSYRELGQGETLCSSNSGSNLSGSYICTAENIVGGDSKSINVVVT